MMHASDTQNVRPAAMAGLFYPDDAGALRAWIDAAVTHARRCVGPDEPPPRAIIAPHAGYVYSGPIAASAYARVAAARDAIERVALIGPAHRVHINGLAASGADAFATPLGNVPLDRGAIEQLLAFDCVHVHDEAHEPEHSLEVHLPFLQCVLDAFTIVPLAMGNISATQVAQAIEALWNERTLIVVSSDLSHYGTYEEAVALDSATSRAIEALCPRDIHGRQACGRPAVQALLALAEQRGLRARTVDQRNSGDTAGPRDRVVGYGAYVFVR